MSFLFNFSICIIFCMNVAVVSVTGEPDLMVKMTNVKNKIFKDYDKYIRPTNDTNTTEVETFILIRQMIELDEDKSLFTLDSFMYMIWYDPRLQWDAEQYEGSLQVPRRLVWTPDISIFNSHSRHVDPTQEVFLNIDPTGRVSWFTPFLTQTSCDATTSRTPYPDDEVRCEVIIESWTAGGREVDFQHSDYVYMHDIYAPNPSWEIVEEKSSTYRNETYYECCPGPHISLHLVLHLRRRPVPEIEATRAPCVLVLLLTLSIFWLPPDSSKKIVLGGFLFVLLNILLVYVGWATKAPLLVLFGVSFLQTSMYIVTITLLLQVLIVTKIASQTGPARPPNAITLVLTGPVGKYACLRSPVQEDVSMDQVLLKEDSTPAQFLTARDEWMLLAAATDRALFLVMGLVMIAVHHL